LGMPQRPGINTIGGKQSAVGASPKGLRQKANHTIWFPLVLSMGRVGDSVDAGCIARSIG
jgi:hypothetical protein